MEELLKQLLSGGTNITINNYNFNLKIEFRMPTAEELDKTLAWLDANDVFESSEERRKLNQRRWEDLNK